MDFILITNIQIYKPNTLYHFHFHILFSNSSFKRILNTRRVKFLQKSTFYILISIREIDFSFFFNIKFLGVFILRVGVNQKNRGYKLLTSRARHIITKSKAQTKPQKQWRFWRTSLPILRLPRRLPPPSSSIIFHHTPPHTTFCTSTFLPTFWYMLRFFETKLKKQ